MGLAVSLKPMAERRQSRILGLLAVAVAALLCSPGKLLFAPAAPTLRRTPTLSVREAVAEAPQVVTTYDLMEMMRAAIDQERCKPDEHAALLKIIGSHAFENNYPDELETLVTEYFDMSEDFIATMTVEELTLFLAHLDIPDEKYEQLVPALNGRLAKLKEEDLDAQAMVQLIALAEERVEEMPWLLEQVTPLVLKLKELPSELSQITSCFKAARVLRSRLLAYDGMLASMLERVPDLLGAAPVHEALDFIGAYESCRADFVSYEDEELGLLQVQKALEALEGAAPEEVAWLLRFFSMQNKRLPGVYEGLEACIAALPDAVQCMGPAQLGMVCRHCAKERIENATVVKAVDAALRAKVPTWTDKEKIEEIPLILLNFAFQGFRKRNVLKVLIDAIEPFMAKLEGGQLCVVAYSLTKLDTKGFNFPKFGQLVSNLCSMKRFGKEEVRAGRLGVVGWRKWRKEALDKMNAEYFQSPET